jgi:hypothetical protein
MPSECWCHLRRLLILSAPFDELRKNKYNTHYNNAPHAWILDLILLPSGEPVSLDCRMENKKALACQKRHTQLLYAANCFKMVQTPAEPTRQLKALALPGLHWRVPTALTLPTPLRTPICLRTYRLMPNSGFQKVDLGVLCPVLASASMPYPMRQLLVLNMNYFTFVGF